MSGRDLREQRTLRHHSTILAIDTEEALLHASVVGNDGLHLFGQFLTDEVGLVGCGEDAHLREPAAAPQPRNEVKHWPGNNGYDKKHRDSVACKIGYGLQNLIKRDIPIGLPRT